MKIPKNIAKEIDWLLRIDDTLTSMLFLNYFYNIDFENVKAKEVHIWLHESNLNYETAVAYLNTLTRKYVEVVE